MPEGTHGRIYAIFIGAGLAGTLFALFLTVVFTAFFWWYIGFLGPIFVTDCLFTEDLPGAYDLSEWTPIEESGIVLSASTLFPENSEIRSGSINITTFKVRFVQRRNEQGLVHPVESMTYITPKSNIWVAGIAVPFVASCLEIPLYVFFYRRFRKRKV
jgi:hypothetical protein